MGTFLKFISSVYRTQNRKSTFPVAEPSLSYLRVAQGEEMLTLA